MSLSSWCSCCAPRRIRLEDDEPLLPQYQDDTARQQKLHQKLHSYQMIRALGKGYMPSTDQLIVNLRTILASDVLNPDETIVSDSGRLLAKYAKQWLTHFTNILRHKNAQDQIQDFTWLLTKSHVSIDVKDLANKAAKVKSTANTVAAYESIKTVGSLLLTNSDFRIFLKDLQVIGREIFSDASHSVSQVAENASQEIAPANGQVQSLGEREPPSNQDLLDDVADVSKTVTNGAAEVGHETAASAKQHLSGSERDALVARLKSAVSKLRYRKDYSDSASIIATLIQRIGMAYSRAARETIDAVQEDTHSNDQMDAAAKNFWSFITSFGDRQEWDQLESCLKKVEEHRDRNPSWERFVTQLAKAVQQALTDPDAIAHIDEKISELQDSVQNTDPSSNLREDVRTLLNQSTRVFKSVMADHDINALFTTSLRLFQIVSPTHNIFNHDLLTDLLQSFVPLFISTIQHIPIPRLEVTTPDIDILLENFILTPGRTVNASSFLPFRLRIETENDLELFRTHNRSLKSVATSLVTIRLDGLTFAAEDFGYVTHVHASPLPFSFSDLGLSSFQLDERGIDIQLDVSISRTSLENILTLKGVRVRVHHLDYQLSQSKFSWAAWLAKPLLRPILRKVLEKQIAAGIADGFHALNREIVFARERLRATRVSDPQDLMTFFKAVAARWQPEPDPEIDVQLGVSGGGRGFGGGGKAGKGVFRGVYAPGSMVKVWEDEGRRAGERVEEWERGGWRNDVFDVVAVAQ